jgi:ribonuclease HI
MVRQVLGKYKVKDADLKRCFSEVQQLLREVPFKFEIVHISREQNKQADELANMAINIGQATAAP